MAGHVGLLAAGALHVGVDPAVGGGADQGAVDHQGLEVALAHPLLQLAGGGALHVEDAHGVAPGQQVLGGRVQPGLPVQRAPGARVAQLRQGVAHHRQAAVAQEVDLHQAVVLHAVLVPGGDGDALLGRGGLEGHVLPQGPGAMMVPPGCTESWWKCPCRAWAWARMAAQAGFSWMPWMPSSQPRMKPGQGLEFGLGPAVGQGHVAQGALGPGRRRGWRPWPPARGRSAGTPRRSPRPARPRRSRCPGPADPAGRRTGTART